MVAASFLDHGGAGVVDLVLGHGEGLLVRIYMFLFLYV